MYKRVVVKIGTSVITENSRLAPGIVEGLATQASLLRQRGIEVVVVTSGAVATGRETLGGSPVRGSASNGAAQMQVYAAVGQIKLMALYDKLFRKKGYQCAQILVTKEDFRDRSHYANMRNCFENLLKQGVVPVVNENDSISIHELVFTDNDELAGLIGSQLNCDAVIFLTSVEGILRDAASTEAIPEIRESDIESFKRFIGDEISGVGRGGMRTKFAIALKLMKQGITVHVLNGTRKNALVDLIDGKRIGTKFLPAGRHGVPAKKVSAVKRRLSYSEGLAAGSVYIDSGAEEVLLSKSAKSLLPVGIVKADGEFKKGDVVEIKGAKGERLGFGVAQYGSAELLPLVGKKGGRAFVHYDYLVVLD